MGAPEAGENSFPGGGQFLFGDIAVLDGLKLPGDFIPGLLIMNLEMNNSNTTNVKNNPNISVSARASLI